MDALLIKTGGLLLIVALGYLLKRRGVFQQGDARLLSRIIVNLTLPGALLSSFSAFRLVPSLLAVLAAVLLPAGGGHQLQPPMSCCWLSPPW